ncbi:MAG: GTP-binding protein [Aliidongia sp.]
MTRTIPLDRYRNIGILASPDAGRTTTTERLLAASAVGDSSVTGAGRSSASVLSWVEQDNERGITLTSAATSCFWRDCRINIVELSATGHLADDGALSVLDGAVIVVDGVAGMTAAVEAALAQTRERGIACLVFVNKLDRAGADLDGIVAAISARGRGDALLLQVPVGAGTGLKGLIDPIGNQATIWADAFDSPGEKGPIPQPFSAEAAEARARIVAAVAPELDGPDAVTLRAKLHEAVRSGRIVPVLCGSAFRNRGIHRLLDAVVDYLPAPSEVTLKLLAADGRAFERHASDDEPFAGLAFQTVDDPSAGKLTFVRIYSGVVAAGGQMLNSVTASPERIGRMVRMHANHAEEVKEARAGDIVALSGLTHTTTGDTLCDPATPVILERMPALAGRVKH